MANGPFGNFGFTPSDELLSEVQQQFQNIVSTGNKDAIRAATVMRGSNVLSGGDPRIRKAQKAEKVLQTALQETGGAPPGADDIQGQKKFYLAAQKAAIEAGLPEVAAQAANTLVELENISLERDKVRATTEAQRTNTEATRQGMQLAEEQGFRNKSLDQIMTEEAAIEARLQNLDPESSAAEKLQNRLLKLNYRKEELLAEREKDKTWTLTQFDDVNEAGVPVRVTARINSDDPNEIVPIASVPLSGLNSSARSGGRAITATVENIANDNRKQSVTASKDYFDSARAYKAAANLGPRGFRSKAASVLLGVLGVENAQEVNKRIVDSVQKTRALGLLPPGPASDRDVEIVMSTALTRDSNSEAIQDMMAASMRVKARENMYYEFFDEYLANQLAQGESVTSIGSIKAWKDYYRENSAQIEAEVNARVNRELGIEVPEEQGSDGGVGDARIIGVTPVSEEQ